MKISVEKIAAFTLIELLVVIAIIGLLASLFVVATREARNRARNMKIETTLSQVRFEATLIYNRDNSYLDLCDATNTLNDTTNDNLRKIEDEVKNVSGYNPSCYTSGAVYCVQSPLVTAGAYCVDFTGYAGKTAINCAAGNISCQ